MAEADGNKERTQAEIDAETLGNLAVRDIVHDNDITPVPALPTASEIVGGEKRNLKYPLDDKDYKGRLVFQLVRDPEENKLIQEATRDAKIKQLENENNQRQKEVEAIERNFGGASQGFSSFGSVPGETYEEFQRRETRHEYFHSVRSKNVASIEENNKEIEKLKGETIETQVNLGPNFSDAGGAEEVIIPTDPNSRVSLYLPMALNFRDNVAYENLDLGISGSFVEAGARSSGLKGKERVDGLTSMIEDITGGVANTFDEVMTGGNKDLGALAATYVNVITKFPGMEGVEGAVKQNVGVTINPNTRSLFKNVAIREFAFQFKFIAKSKKEADEVRDIVKFFRTELYPEALLVQNPDSKFSVAIGYKFPKKFIITPMYNNSPIPDTKILPCFLRDVSVVYNPSGQSMHGGDNPHFTEIDMSLAFTETRTLTRQEIEMEGGY